MNINNFQRIGAISNAHVGKYLESIAQEYFRQQGIFLDRNYSIPVGVVDKKIHHFDLGSGEPPILVECKSNTWTTSDNVPSAKITVWNEAMYYFHLAPPKFRKILFVKRDFSKKRSESLATYYKRCYGHLIPRDVEILECDEKSSEVIAVPTTRVL